VCRGIGVRKASAPSRPTAFDSGKLPDLAETKAWVKSNKGMKSSTKPVPFSQPSAIVIEFVASLHVLAKKRTIRLKARIVFPCMS
jgi:hypothetical protein